MTLYYIYMDGCGACEAAKPVLAEWERKHPGVPVVRHNLLNDKWTAEWQVKATPTYVVAIPGHRPAMYEGALSENDISRFIEVAKKTVGAR